MHGIRYCCVLILVFLLGAAVSANAQQRNRGGKSGINPQLEQRIRELEEKIEALEKEKKEEESASELELLLQQADDMSSEKADDEISANKVFKGEERQQQQLNPEISMNGDFVGAFSSSTDERIEKAGDYTDGRNQIMFREAELSVMAPLDPFTRGKFFLGIPGSGSEEPLTSIIEEAYMEWLNLPGGINLKVGEFITQFGELNRWHTHGLPQVDRPLPLVRLFGNENFGGVGIAGNILLPSLTAHVNELDLSVTSGGDGISFDDSYRNIVGVARYKNYYDINRDTYFELGLSGAHGYNNEAEGHKTTLGAVDMTLKWVPAARSHYRTTEFKAEMFMSHRETAGDDLDRYGFLTLIHNKLGARFWHGLRFSYTELPLSVADEHEWEITPSIDFWQSEFVMLRAQYTYTERSYMEKDHTIFLQTIWAMGPHKHDVY